jgi:hypothetical protein
MKLIKNNFTIAIIPLLVVIWGIILLLFYDPSYSKSSDPEYPYLVNGLNCALLHFNRIGLIEHPGTPFQMFCGLSILGTYLISGGGGIAQDVFSRPEHYITAISISLLIVQAVLIFAIGIIGSKKKISFWQIAILQASCFYNEISMLLFGRVNIDRFFMIVCLIFILIYLKHGFENKSSKKFAIWSGTAMALGLASKFNFLPLLFLPLFIINSNKNRLIYIGSAIASFFLFISPIIDKLDDYQRFLTSIFKHDGLYGSGATKILNFQKMLDSTLEIFMLNPGLYLLIPVLIFLIILAIRNRGKKESNQFLLLFVGFLVIMAIQTLIVSKHFKNYYLEPIFSMYGFIFFSISLFLSTVFKKKNHLILACNILPLIFIFISFGKIINGAALISKLTGQQEKIKSYVDNEISKNDFWFIEPTWESGPHVENALVYGLCYCAHRTDYFPQVMAVNPNVITYEGNNDQVKLWRCFPVSLDSVVATGKNVYVYSTPGRNAAVLTQMLKDAAARNSIQLQIDTVYNDIETNRKIIKAKGLNTCSIWQTSNTLVVNRQTKIDNFIKSIKNSPEWIKNVQEKATLKNIPLDSMILLDAIWMVDNEK